MDPPLKFDTLSPGNIGVRITVYSEIDGQTTDLLFQQLPVRIGRNKLNDLVLAHQYVSQWHAILGFVRGQLSIVQVGSSNSVVVNDRRLNVNENMVIGGQESIRIVPFTLHVQVVSLPGQMQEQQQPHVQENIAAAAAASGSDPASLEQIALKVLDSMTTRFLGQTLDDPQQLAQFGGRVEATLDVFLRCFVALQKGQQQFREAMDIKVLQETGGLIDRVGSGSELAAMLLAGPTEAILSLEQAFKNIMIHQVALLNGLMAGVRTLLAKLSPEAVTKEAGRSKRSPNLRQLWQTYEQIHRDLAEEDNETFETIFGRQFGKAYATLAGGRSSRKK